MTHVIVQGCCNDASCVSACPVDCIHPTPGEPAFRYAAQLYIDASTCIDCGACLDVCPADAVRTDVGLARDELPFVEINDSFYAGRGHTSVPVAPTPPPRPQFLEGPLRVAIIGAGPSGCYAAAALLDHSDAQISVIDRLPTPHGLLRAGVAPDHQSTKKVGRYFDSVLAHPSVSCYFNVTVGEDIDLEEIRAHHDAVIWSAGASGDRPLGIPGEELAGCHPAREMVGWYNGHPDFVDTEFDLSGARAVIVGNGNVSMDVARMLVLDGAALARTDMAPRAVAALASSRITEVVVAGRRGPEHAAYTLSELIGLTQLDGVAVRTEPREVAHSIAAAPGDIPLRVLLEASSREGIPGESTIHMRYLLAPVSINGSTRVESVTFMLNEIVVDERGSHIRPTGHTETVETNLVLKAVGYRGRPVHGLPFDERSGTIPHVKGQVVEWAGPDEATAIDGMFCAGWIKRGPTGVIGTNKQCSLETVTTLLEAMNGSCQRVDASSFNTLIASRTPDLVDFEGWIRIRQAEESNGRSNGTPRRKITVVEDMLAASLSQDGSALVP